MIKNENKKTNKENKRRNNRKHRKNKKVKSKLNFNRINNRLSCRSYFYKGETYCNWYLINKHKIKAYAPVPWVQLVQRQESLIPISHNHISWLFTELVRAPDCQELLKSKNSESVRSHDSWVKMTLTADSRAQFGIIVVIYYISKLINRINNLYFLGLIQQP